MKWEKVINLPYDVVFVKLFKSKMESEYQDRSSEVLKAKNRK